MLRGINSVVSKRSAERNSLFPLIYMLEAFVGSRQIAGYVHTAEWSRRRAEPGSAWEVS